MKTIVSTSISLIITVYKYPPFNNKPIFCTVSVIWVIEVELTDHLCFYKLGPDSVDLWRIVLQCEHNVYGHYSINNTHCTHICTDLLLFETIVPATVCYEPFNTSVMYLHSNVFTQLLVGFLIGTSCQNLGENFV